MTAETNATDNALPYSWPDNETVTAHFADGCVDSKLTRTISTKSAVFEISQKRSRLPNPEDGEQLYKPETTLQLRTASPGVQISMRMNSQELLELSYAAMNASKAAAAAEALEGLKLRSSAPERKTYLPLTVAEDYEHRLRHGAWMENPNDYTLVRGRTVNGNAKTHWPGCSSLRRYIAVADAIAEGKSPTEAGGRCFHPEWVSGDWPTCSVCIETALYGDAG